MKKIFYMMRHGQTLFNVRRKIQGWCDSPLTQLGVKQAEAAKQYFDDVEVDYLYSSTTERASDTLEIIKPNREYKRLKGLREMNFGTFEGESEDLNPDKETFETFFVNYGGESRDMVKKRLSETCVNIMESEDHNTVLAVSHAGACFHFMRVWESDERVNEELKKGFSNCCIFKYEYDDETKRFSLIEGIRRSPME